MPTRTGGRELIVQTRPSQRAGPDWAAGAFSSTDGALGARDSGDGVASLPWMRRIHGLAKTRFRRCAQLRERCRLAADASPLSLAVRAAAERVPGTTRARSGLAGPIRRLQCIPHLAAVRQRESLGGNRRPRDIARQALDLVALRALGRDARVQRETRAFGHLRDPRSTGRDPGGPCASFGNGSSVPSRQRAREEISEQRPS